MNNRILELCTLATRYDTTSHPSNFYGKRDASGLRYKRIFSAAISPPFCPESRVLIPQMQVWYQSKGFLMLCKNDVASLYEKLWSTGRKWSKHILEMNKMAAGRHLEFDKLVPPAHACASESLFRTPWATSVPNFSSSLQKKTNFHFFGSWLGNYIILWSFMQIIMKKGKCATWIWCTFEARP